jgi:MFS family permease
MLFSIKPIFLTSNVIVLIGSLLCAAATSSAMFVVGRAVTGLGFAGEMAGCFAVLVQILPLKRRPGFAALMACVEMVAVVAAPIVGGALTQSLGWRWCFWYTLFHRRRGQDSLKLTFVGSTFLLALYRWRAYSSSSQIQKPGKRLSLQQHRRSESSTLSATACSSHP